MLLLAWITNSGFLTRSGSARRRVTANSMPIDRPTASIDEPPLEMNGKCHSFGRHQPDIDRHIDNRLQREEQG